MWEVAYALFTFVNKLVKFIFKFLIFNFMLCLLHFSSNFLTKCVFPNFDDDIDFLYDPSDGVNPNELDDLCELSKKYFDYTKFLYEKYGKKEHDFNYGEDMLLQLKNNRNDIISFFKNEDRLDNLHLNFNYCNFLKSFIDCMSANSKNAFETEEGIDDYITKYDMFSGVEDLKGIFAKLCDGGYLSKNNPLIDDEYLKANVGKFIEYYKNFTKVCYAYKDDKVEVDGNLADTFFAYDKLSFFCDFMLNLFSYIYSDPYFILNYVLKRFCNLVIPDYIYIDAFEQYKKNGGTKTKEDFVVLNKLEWFSKIFDFRSENTSVMAFIEDEQEDDCSSDTMSTPFILNYKNGPIQSFRCLSNMLEEKLDSPLEYSKKIKKNSEDNKNIENERLFSDSKSYLDFFLVKLRYFYNFICWNRLFCKWENYLCRKRKEADNLQHKGKSKQDSETLLEEYIERDIKDSSSLFKYANYSLKEISCAYEQMVGFRKNSFFKELYNYETKVDTLISNYNTYFLDILTIDFPCFNKSIIENMGQFFDFLHLTKRDTKMFFDKFDKKEGVNIKGSKSLAKKLEEEINFALSELDNQDEQQDNFISNEHDINSVFTDVVDKVSIWNWEPVVKYLEGCAFDPKYLSLYGKIFKPKYLFSPLYVSLDISNTLMPSKDITPDYSKYVNSSGNIHEFKDELDVYSVFEKFLNDESKNLENYNKIKEKLRFYEYVKSHDDAERTKDSDEGLLYLKNFFDEDIFSHSEPDNVYFIIYFIYNLILKPFQEYRNMTDLLSNFYEKKGSHLRDLLTVYFSFYGKNLRNKYNDKDLKLNWFKHFQSFYWDRIFKPYLYSCREMLFEHINKLGAILGAADWVLGALSILHKAYGKLAGFENKVLEGYLERLVSYCNIWRNTFCAAYDYLNPVGLDDVVCSMKDYIDSKHLGDVTNVLHKLFNEKISEFCDIGEKDTSIETLINNDLKVKLEKNPNFDVVKYNSECITPKIKKLLLDEIENYVGKMFGKEKCRDICVSACDINFNKQLFMDGLREKVNEDAIDTIKWFFPPEIKLYDFESHGFIKDKAWHLDPLFEEIISSVKRTPEYNACVNKLNFMEDLVQLAQCKVNLKVFDKACEVIRESLVAHKSGTKQFSNIYELISYCKNLNLDDLRSNTNLPICILLDNINYVYLKYYCFPKWYDNIAFTEEYREYVKETYHGCDTGYKPWFGEVEKTYNFLSEQIRNCKAKLKNLKKFAESL